MATPVPPSNISDVKVKSADITDMSNFTPRPKVLVSDEECYIMQVILYGVLIPTICSFGIVSNIINIICFVRQSLKDPVNVSLLGLALSDLGCLVCSLGIAICFNPGLQRMDLPVVIFDLVYITWSQPLYLFTGLSSWITALITLERCLCITNPIKVKSIITPKRVSIIIVSLFILFTFNASPMYYVSELSWVFSPERNRTILRLAYTDGRAIAEQFSFYVNSGSTPFSAYITIIICTNILVVKLRTNTKWRQSCTGSASADKTSKRDQKLARMVMAVSVMFIACLTPICLSAICMIAVPGLAIDGPNQNLLYVYGGISVALESANSSANIFIYFRMSSKYRSTFLDLFSCWKE